MSTKKVPAKKAAKKAATKVPSKKAAKKAPPKKIATKAPAKKVPRKVAKKVAAKKAPKKIALTQALMAKAASTLGDKKQLKDLVGAAVKKVGKIEMVSFKENFIYLKAMVRLLKAYSNRAYREVSWQSLLTITGAVIYLVNPFDLIPDLVPFFGLQDDAAVIALALGAVKGVLDDFLDWEAETA